MAQRAATERLTTAAHRLAAQGISARDIGAVQGLPYQPAPQLTR